MDYTQLETLIRSRRKELNLSQKVFAFRIGKKPTTYNYIERNLDKINFKTLSVILDALGLKIIIVPGDQIK